MADVADAKGIPLCLVCRWQLQVVTIYQHEVPYLKPTCCFFFSNAIKSLALPCAVPSAANMPLQQRPFQI
jgi:hypothetical protein